MGKTPKENPEDRKARLRERRISSLERDTATQQTAADLTSDLKSIYGFRGIPLAFGQVGTTVKPVTRPKPLPVSDRGGSNR